MIAMRQATKNIFYTTVNSSAYENYVPGTIPAWLRMVYAADAVIAALLLMGEVLAVRNYRKKKQAMAGIDGEE
uniref:hypothetical protein n=1 Tax=Enterocloster clostridioformis TaxID=1531 RepID=UPI0026774D21|nr:hypothetical protein [Enterocloster clostridioformis]